jgi:methionyl-tRNA formyltransferase
MNRHFRVILLTHGGTEQVLRKLLEVDSIHVAGVFIETETARYYPLRDKIRRSIRYDGYRGTAAKAIRRLSRLSGQSSNDADRILESRKSLQLLASSAAVPLHFVANYHAEEARKLLREANADLGVVCGTNILKESVFKIPRLGSINLHQGLAPYYRGGPAVFWELFNGESEVGLTIHFVESKVDSGAIVLQDTVPLIYDYSFGLDFESFISEFRNRLVDRCAQLVAEAVRQIADGASSFQPQDTTVGKRYRLPIKSEKDEMRRRLRQRWVHQREAAPQSMNIHPHSG